MQVPTVFLVILKRKIFKDPKFMARHQISYYILEYQLVDGSTGDLADMLNRVLTYINGLSLVDRKRDDNSQDKFSYLSSLNTDGDMHAIIMKSARHSYSAPLVHRQTLHERPNPKLLEEGEQVKTHCVINAISGYMTKDTLLGGVAINNFVNYINSFLPQVYSANETAGAFIYAVIPCDNFRDEINRLDRVSVAEIVTDRHILGGPALNFNGRMDEIQEDVTVTVKARRGENIKNQALSWLIPSLNNHRVRRVRIKGRDEFGNERILDSLNLIKKTYVNVEKDEHTGEFNSQSMLTELQSALSNLQ